MTVVGEVCTLAEIDLQAARADTLPPRSGGEGGEVRSTEPGGGRQDRIAKGPPPLTPPRRAARGGGEPNRLEFIAAFPLGL